MQVRGDADTIAFEHCDHFNSIIPNNFMKDNKVFLSGSNGYKVDWVFAWIYKCISLLFGLHARSLWPTYSLARFCRGDLYYRTNWDSKMQPKDRTFFENTNIEFVAPSYTFACPMILVTKRINSWNSLGLVDASHKTTKCVNTEDKRSLVDTYNLPFFIIHEGASHCDPWCTMFQPNVCLVLASDFFLYSLRSAVNFRFCFLARKTVTGVYCFSNKQTLSEILQTLHWYEVEFEEAFDWQSISVKSIDM